jgi:hypothetical protein
LDDYEDNPLESPKFKEMLARLQKRNNEHREKCLNSDREWPPKEHLVKEWEAHGLKCAITHDMIYCGYVRVPLTHPLAGKYYDHEDIESIRVHGGVTFCTRSNDGFWIGFDCGHGFDWFGYHDSATGIGYEHPGMIWTEEDVMKETERLAEQLQKIGRGGGHEDRNNLL